MKRLSLWILSLLVMAFSSCREEELDMTIVQKTLVEGVEINEISAEDAWAIQVLQDADDMYVELEYSAFLEDYIYVNVTENALSIGFNKSIRLPNNTVINATVHTPAVHKLSFSDAVIAAVDGLFPETALILELDDAATCRGGHFNGSADIKLSDASTLLEFYFEGTTCSVELDETSVFKGCLNVSGDLTLNIKEASRLTDYWGEINHAVVEVSDAGYLNMATSWINRMQIAVKSASEATVNVVESLEGYVHDASKLYYSGDPTINVDCDETSILERVDYPSPQ